MEGSCCMTKFSTIKGTLRSSPCVSTFPLASRLPLAVDCGLTILPISLPLLPDLGDCYSGRDPHSCRGLQADPGRGLSRRLRKDRHCERPLFISRSSQASPEIELLLIPLSPSLLQTDEQAPLPAALDLIIKRVVSVLANPEADWHFNCQMGRGRTTTGQIVACLVSSVVSEESSAEIVETSPSDQETNPLLNGQPFSRPLYSPDASSTDSA
jgi:hypothetical protein